MFDGGNQGAKGECRMGCVESMCWPKLLLYNCCIMTAIRPIVAHLKSGIGIGTGMEDEFAAQVFCFD